MHFQKVRLIYISQMQEQMLELMQYYQTQVVYQKEVIFTLPMQELMQELPRQVRQIGTQHTVGETMERQVT